MRRIDGLHNRCFLDPVLLGRYPADVLDDLGPLVPDCGCVRDGDLETIAQPLDLLGVNYYSAARGPRRLGVPRAADSAEFTAPRRSPTAGRHGWAGRSTRPG